jgi:hypothetical protein
MSEIYLSAKGLKNVHGDFYPNDFRFIVGRTAYLGCSFVASFLSPKIARLRRCDPTIPSYSIETEDKLNEFFSVLALAEGSPVGLRQWNRMFFLDVSMELENAELYDLVLAGFGGKLKAKMRRTFWLARCVGG